MRPFRQAQVADDLAAFERNAHGLDFRVERFGGRQKREYRLAVRAFFAR